MKKLMNTGSKNKDLLSSVPYIYEDQYLLNAMGTPSISICTLFATVNETLNELKKSDSASLGLSKQGYSKFSDELAQLERLLTEIQSSTQFINQKIQNLKKPLNQASQGNTSNSGIKKPNIVLKQITDYIQDKLFKNNRVFFPLTYAQMHTDTQFICELKKNQKGNLQLLLWDNGGGIDKHQHKEELTEPEYAPVRVFNLNQKVNKQLPNPLIKLIQKLFNLKVSSQGTLHPSYSEEELFSKMLPQLFALNAKEVDFNTLNLSHIKPCGFENPLTALWSIFEKDGNSVRTVHLIKAKLFEKIIRLNLANINKTLNSTALNFAIKSGNVDKGIVANLKSQRNLILAPYIKLIQQFKKSNSLDPQSIKLQENKYRKYKNTIDKMIKVLESKFSKKTLNKPLRLLKSLKPKKSDFQFKAKRISLSQPFISKTKLPTPPKHVAPKLSSLQHSVSGYIKFLTAESLKLSPKTKIEKLEYIRKIEDAIFDFKLDDHFWQNMDKKQAKVFSLRLFNFYYKICKLKINNSIDDPVRDFIFNANIQALQEIAAKIYFKDKPRVLQSIFQPTSDPKFLRNEEGLKDIDRHNEFLNGYDSLKNTILDIKIAQRLNEVKDTFKRHSLSTFNKLPRTLMTIGSYYPQLAKLAPNTHDFSKNRNWTQNNWVMIHQDKILPIHPNAKASYYYLNNMAKCKTISPQADKDYSFYFTFNGCRILSQSPNSVIPIKPSPTTANNQQNNFLTSPQGKITYRQEGFFENRKYKRYATPSLVNNEKTSFTFDDYSIRHQLREYACIRRNHYRENPGSVFNTSQVRYASNPLSIKNEFKRALSTITCQEEAKINLTLGFLGSNLPHMNHPDLQLLCFLNLFNSGYLAQQFSKTPYLINHMNEYFGKGILYYYKDNKVTPTVLFYLQLATTTYNYFSNYEAKNATEKKALKEGFKSLNNILSHLSSMIKQLDNFSETTLDDQQHLARLLQLQAIYINAKEKINKGLSSKEKSLYFQSLFRLNTLPLPKDSMSNIVSSLFKEAKHECYFRHLNNHSKLDLHGIIAPYVDREDKQKVKHAQVKGSFPKYSIAEYVFDLKEGDLTKSGAQLKALPKEFYNSELYKEFFSKQRIKNIKKIGTFAYEFMHNNTPYRIIDEVIKTPQFTLQKTFHFDPGTWYAYDSTNDTITSKFSSHRHFPKTLHDTHHRVWHSTVDYKNLRSFTCNDILIENTLNPKTIKHFSGKTQTWYEMSGLIKSNIPKQIQVKDKFKSRLRLLDINHALFKSPVSHIKYFEDPRYIEVWENTQSNQLNIKLPRYDLEFVSTKSSNGQLNLTWSKDKSYKLCANNKTGLSGFKNFLTLVDDSKQPNRFKVLIPRQNWNKATNGLQISALAKKTSNQANNSASTLFLSNRYSIFDCGQSNELIPNRKEDPFFWAYLASENNEKQKCLRQLKHYGRYFTGTTDEAHYLFKIINSKNVNSLEHFALKAHSAFILISFFKSGQELTNMDNDALTQSYFVIFKLIESYFKQKEKINPQYHLSDKQELEFLQFFDSYKVKNISILRQNHLKVKLRQLKNKQYENELAISHTSSDRKEKIKSLATKPIAKKKQTNLENGFVSFSLDNSEFSNINSILENYKSNKSANAKTIAENKKDPSKPQLPLIQLPKPLTISQLDLDSDEERFVISFMDLYDEAQSDPSKAKALNTHLDKLLSIIPKQPKISMPPELVEKLKSQLPMTTDPFVAMLLKTITWQGCQLPENHTALNITDELTNINEFLNAIKTEFKRRLSTPQKLALMLQAMLAHPEKVKKIKAQKEDLPYTFYKLISKFSSQKFTLPIPLQRETAHEPIIIPFNPKKPIINEIQKPLNLEIKSVRSLWKREGFDDSFFDLKANKLSTGVLPDIFSHQKDDSPISKKMIQEANKDYKEGVKLNRAEKDLFDNFSKGFQNTNLRAFQKRLAKQAAHNQKVLSALETKIISTYNQIFKPLDPTQTHLQSAFSWFADDHFFTDSPNSPEIDKLNKQLNSLIHTYLLNGTRQQQQNRVTHALNQLLKTAHLKNNPNKHIDLKNQMSKFGNFLTAKRAFDSKDYPMLLLFEYLDDKLIYPSQFNIYKTLSQENKDGNGFKSQQTQMIMGGGKSKVIIPLLMKKMAKGNNLAFCEVPSALLDVNFKDLSETSSKVYDQNANIFKFHRGVDANSTYFKNLLQHWRSIMVNKEYIVTDRKAMRSLLLKYAEILTTPMEDVCEWESMIHYCGKLISLIQHKGDAVLDEIDSTLHCKDQLIYTSATGIPLNEGTIAFSLKFFDFFNRVKLNNKKPTFTLGDIVQGKLRKLSQKKMQDLFKKLSLQLIHDKHSPIAHCVKGLSSTAQKECLKYFHNDLDYVPNFILKLKDSDKDMIAFCKEQISRLLPLSFKRNKNEQYGLPKEEKSSPAIQEIAIPYKGSNTPDEKAKFQNPLLTLNYTLLIQLAKDTPLFAFERLIEKFKAEKDVEDAANALVKHPKHFVQKKFSDITKLKCLLKDINLEDKGQIKKLHAQAKSLLSVKKHCLEHFILPFIIDTSKTLGANAQNHASMYRSVVGFTGTDYNYRTMPDSLYRDTSESFGTDGKTIDNLMRRSLKRPHLLNTDNFQSIQQIIEKHPNIQNVRALIDVGAVCKGIGNRNIANNLSHLFAKKPSLNPSIKKILYFNDAEELCALDVSATPEKCQEKVLGSSENLEQHLGCQAHEYFTFYDQRRTTGTDIQQAPHTIGITTVSKDTILRDMLQGGMRLRQLKETQKIDFVVMKSLQDENPSIKKWDLSTLMNVALRNQNTSLLSGQKQHFTSSIQKMHNVIRSHCMAHIVDAPSLMKQIIYSDAFSDILYNNSSGSLFDKYGLPENWVPSKEVFSSLKNRLMDQWALATKRANLEDAKEHKQIVSELNTIAQKAVKICEPLQRNPLSGQQESQVIAQNEVQSEVQQETQKEEQLPRIGSKPFKPFDKKIDLTHWSPKSNSCFGVKLRSLNKLLDSHPVKRNFQLSGNLYASENFFNNCRPFKSDKINDYKKGLGYCLVIADNSNVSQVIITPKEAVDLGKSLDNIKLPAGKSIWIESLKGILFRGKKPSHKNLPAQYFTQFEQRCFYQADISSLLSNIDDLNWLKQNASDKLNFLKHHLISHHPSQKILWNTFIQKLDGIDKNDLLFSSSKKIKGPTHETRSWQHLKKLFNHEKLFKKPQVFNPPIIDDARHTRQDLNDLNTYCKRRNSMDKVRPQKSSFKESMVYYIKRAIIWCTAKLIKYPNKIFGSSLVAGLILNIALVATMLLNGVTGYSLLGLSAISTPLLANCFKMIRTKDLPTWCRIPTYVGLIGSLLLNGLFMVSFSSAIIPLKVLGILSSAATLFWAPLLFDKYLKPNVLPKILIPVLSIGACVCSAATAIAGFINHWLPALIISSATLVIGSGIALREVYKINKARQIKEKGLASIQADSTEHRALKSGIRASASWKGYFSSFVNSSSYRSPSAYYAGMSLHQLKNSVFCDKILSKKQSQKP